MLGILRSNEFPKNWDQIRQALENSRSDLPSVEEYTKLRDLTAAASNEATITASVLPALVNLDGLILDRVTDAIVDAQWNKKNVHDWVVQLCPDHACSKDVLMCPHQLCLNDNHIARHEGHRAHIQRKHEDVPKVQVTSMLPEKTIINNKIEEYSCPDANTELLYEVQLLYIF